MIIPSEKEEMELSHGRTDLGQVFLGAQPMDMRCGKESAGRSTE
jgi:hypothetical protein